MTTKETNVKKLNVDFSTKVQLFNNVRVTQVIKISKAH